MIRTGSYYAYNADDGSFLACGSSNKMWGFFGISTNALRYHLNNDKIYNSRKYDLRLKIKWVDGVIEDIEPTIKLKPKPILQIEKKPNKLKCNFIEVFRVFKEPRNEEEKEYMRTHFSIINLDKVRFELDTRSFNDGFPFRINFTGKGRLRSIIFSEKFYSRKLAEERLRYLQDFQAKQRSGDFWYFKDKYDASRVVCVDRTRSGKNKIMSPSRDTTKKTNYKEYLDLVQFLQSEFIR